MALTSDKESISKQSKRVIIGLVLIAFIIYFITSYQNKQLRSGVRKSEFSGIITSYDVDNGRRGYYYTNKKDIVIASYFFYDYNTRQQLNLSDSIYKAPDSFRLYIYKKDEKSKYIFDRLAIKYNDSVSPYSFYNSSITRLF